MIQQIFYGVTLSEYLKYGTTISLNSEYLDPLFFYPPFFLLLLFCAITVTHIEYPQHVFIQK